MRISFLGFFFICLFQIQAFGETKVIFQDSDKVAIRTELARFYHLSEGVYSEIFESEVISTAEVATQGEFQNLKLIIAGIHPKSCPRAMRKLSLYEQYSSYMDFIKKSLYDEKKKEIFFFMDHALMPFAMTLRFNLPRIQGEGHYSFTFKDGFLKDLKGTVIVKEIQNHCLLALKADWVGKQTKIPNLVFETFLETVGKIGLEHLIRVSLF